MKRMLVTRLNSNIENDNNSIEINGRRISYLRGESSSGGDGKKKEIIEKQIMLFIVPSEVLGFAYIAVDVKDKYTLHVLN